MKDGKDDPHLACFCPRYHGPRVSWREGRREAEGGGEGGAKRTACPSLPSRVQYCAEGVNLRSVLLPLEQQQQQQQKHEHKHKSWRDPTVRPHVQYDTRGGGSNTTSKDTTGKLFNNGRQRLGDSADSIVVVVTPGH